jgi:hypothetical protein
LETDGGQFAVLLEVAIASTPPTNDESIAWVASYLRIEERGLRRAG